MTPISQAVMMSVVANGGTRFIPHLIRAFDDGNGWKKVTPPPPARAVQLQGSTASALHDGLWLVVNGGGTGGRGRIPGLDVSGKTGTARSSR